MANLIKVDTSDLEKLTKFLRKNSRKGGAIAIAIQRTLNDTAFEGRKRAIRHTIPRVMTVRNKSYVNRSIAVNKVPNGKQISDMESQLGANAKVFGKRAIGWKEMETGKTVTGAYRGRYTFHATKYARRGDYGKSVSPKKRVTNLSRALTAKGLINKNNLASSARDRNKQLIAVAIKNKLKEPFILSASTGKGRGIFEIKAGKLKKLYSMGKKRYSIKKRKWLSPASEYASKRSNKFYQKNALKQVQRLEKKLGIKYR